MHLQTLVSWWSDYPEELLTQRVLQPLQSYLTTELVVTKKLTVSVMNTIKVLAKIEEANQIGRKLPPEAFYNELIRYRLDLALSHSVSDTLSRQAQVYQSPCHSFSSSLFPSMRLMPHTHLL